MNSTCTFLVVEETNTHTLLSFEFIVWYGVEVAAEATGVVGMAFGQCQGDVAAIINGNCEAKLLTPELERAELRSDKHSVGGKWQWNP